MARSKKKRAGGAAHPSPPPAHAPVDPGPAAEWGAAIGVALCATLTWMSRWALNPDGVAYLDLAQAARSGSWPAFVQGYWSPLYPGLLALLGAGLDASRTSLIVLSHVVNGVAAVGAVMLLWRWGRRSGRPWSTPALLATFLLASNGLPRIEGVTPDILLLALMAWVGFELLHHRGARPVLTGLALGLSFLAKTSVWPWLLLSVPLRHWGAEGPDGRRRVLISSGVALLLAAVWIVPVSLEEGRVTPGSAGRLNYTWYIEGSDARSPDTHRGRHQAARTIALDSATGVEVYTFDTLPRWTYAPWSDPTAWSAGILASNARPPRIPDLLAHWGDQALVTFGLWVLPVLLGVVVPCAIAFRSSHTRWRPLRDHRAHLAILLLALAGILQFVAVHSEPRLIAPFLLLFGLTALDAIFAQAGPAGGGRRGPIAIAVAWIVVGGMSTLRLGTWVKAGPRIAAATDRILAGQARPLAGAPAPREILVVGPAMPVAPAAFIAGVRIAAQLPPASAGYLLALPSEQQDALLRQAAAGRLRGAWITDERGGVTVVPIPPP